MVETLSYLYYKPCQKHHTHLQFQYNIDDPDLDPAVVVETSNFEKVQRERLALAFGNLDDRSREIMQRRWLSEKKATLHELADYYEISAERVRQLEQNALKKLRLSFA